MQRQLVTLRKISELLPIEGADQIEIAKVDGWQCVVKKGVFKVDDIALYFEIDSLLPMRPQFEFLRPRGTKKMIIDQKEVEGYRLRTIRLKGQLSQGLLLPVSDFFQNCTLSSSEDITDFLDVIKYEAPIPACLAGTMKGNFPSFIAKTDQERVQNIMQDLVAYESQSFEVTEKLDGSSMTVYINDGEFGVCSRNMDLKETEGNTFWRVAREMDLENKMKEMGGDFALQGELCGPVIQGNPYKLSAAKMFIFDVFDINLNQQLCPEQRIACLKTMDLESSSVPVIDLDFPLTLTAIAFLLTFAEGPSILFPDAQREGIVFKSNSQPPFHFKVISNKYLLDERDA